MTGSNTADPNNTDEGSAFSGANPITDGDLVGPMIGLAWPIVVTQLLQVAYNIVDTLWLGRVSASAVAAVSLAFPLIFLLISVGDGFTVAGSVLVAQYVGSKSEESAGKVVAQTMGLVTVFSVVVGVAGYFGTDAALSILPAQGTTQDLVVPMAADFMRIFFLGLPFLFGFYVFSALMRGYGDTRTPMKIMLVSVVLNLVLDPVLIFGFGPLPGLEVEGAAIATVVSRGVATLLGVYVLFFSVSGPSTELSQFVPDFDMIAQIVRIGTPTAIESSTTAFALITLTAMAVTFAPPVVAAYGLVNRLASLVYLPAMGIGRATNTMVGQNLGAEKPERAESAVWLAAKVSTGVMVIVAIVSFLAAEPVTRVFMATGTTEAAETVRFATEYLRIRSLEFIFVGLFQVVLGAYHGSGNTKTALGFSLLALWVGRVAVVYYLVFVVSIGPTGIWIGMTLGSIVGAVAATFWFRRGTWKKSVIENR